MQGLETWINEGA